MNSINRHKHPTKETYIDHLNLNPVADKVISHPVAATIITIASV